jgi:hypothetical protein
VEGKEKCLCMRLKCGQEGITEHRAQGFVLIYTAVIYTCHQNTVCHGKKANCHFHLLAVRTRCSLKRTLWYGALSLTKTEFHC